MLVNAMSYLVQIRNVNVDTTIIENTYCEKLLGVKIDNRLNFENHIENIYGKARSKISALLTVTPFMSLDKRKSIPNAFFKAQFNYCPLIWMLHERKLNNKINRFYKRCLCIVYSDNLSTYEELLQTDNSVSVHHCNIQSLAIELYMVVNGTSPNTMKDVFPLNSSFRISKIEKHFTRGPWKLLNMILSHYST